MNLIDKNIFTYNKLYDLLYLILQIGLEVKKSYNNNIDIKYKADKTPVTNIDILANNMICNYLKNNFPNINIISEENNFKDNIEIYNKFNHFFIIDPIDGTDAFIKKNGNFTINIAYSYNNNIIFSIIYEPMVDIIYFTYLNKSYQIHDFSHYIISKKNLIDNKLELTKKNKNNIKDNYKIIISKRPSEEIKIKKYLEEKNINYEILKKISSSYKFCLIADKSHDLHIRNSALKIWDIASGISLIKNSGGNFNNIIFNNLTLMSNEFIIFNS